MFDETILPKKLEKTWTSEDVDWSVSVVVNEPNTNFDSLIKNLENNTDLYKVVYELLVEGGYYTISVYDPTAAMGLMYGIFKNGSGITTHNRIYAEISYNYMTSKVRSEAILTENSSCTQPQLNRDGS